MIDLGGLPQPRAGLGATALLQPAQEFGVVTRRVPQPPCGHTRGMPCCVLVRAAIPQILMPAEAIHRLTAHAAEARAMREFLLAIGHRRAAETDRQVFLTSRFKPPDPPVRRAAAARERARQAIGAQRRGAPASVDCQARPWRYPTAGVLRSSVPDPR